MRGCAKRQYGTRAHKAKLYKIEDKVVKINQTIHDVLRGLYFTYCFDWRLNFFYASRTSLGSLTILAQFSTKTCPLSKMEFLYALSCVEPSLSWLKKQNWPRVFGLVSIVFGY